MKLCISGYGHMGKEVEAAALEKSIKVARIIDYKDNIADINFDADEVVIDFTNSEAFLKNLPIYAKKGVNLVCGTTGWYDKSDEVKKIVEDNNIGFLYASNFSIGVHLFWNILHHAAEVMNKSSGYDAMGYELHHKGKKDSPSGTAITTGKILLEHLDSKDTLVTETLHRQIKDNELQFSSIRGGDINGTHTVIFDSFADTIEISHIAKNRSGFAIGAVECAQWLEGKKGFYTIEDYLRTVY